MSRRIHICLLGCLLVLSLVAQAQERRFTGVDFCGIRFEIPLVDLSASPSLPYSRHSVHAFETKLDPSQEAQIRQQLLEIRDRYQLEDWIFYQLIRKTAQQLSPKQSHYDRYTLTKWWLLKATGYRPLLRISKDQILLYIQSNDNIYNLPSLLVNGETYICLNFHDYPPGTEIDRIDFATYLENGSSQQSGKPFSYVVKQLPDFPTDTYTEKALGFSLRDHRYEFTIRVNPQMKTLFANYPVTDFENYFNIPMSRETYNSLIPALRKQVSSLSPKQGVDYLMRFTRYAFMYTSDQKQFGMDKRFSPEQTLLYGQSDCDDRAALFFYLVKEIYNLPMLVLAYPQHVTIAVQLPKTRAKGNDIHYNGQRYVICEPTPQRIDLNMGQVLPEMKNQSYEIVYAYHPNR